MTRLMMLLRDLRDTKEPSIRARRKLITHEAVKSTLKPPEKTSARAIRSGIVR